MAELATLARPYAKAAFEYALAANSLDQWSGMLALAAQVAQQDAVRKLLGSPAITAEVKGQSFVDLCGDALDVNGQNFVRNLAANKRLGLLPQIGQLFEAFKAQQEKTVEVEIISAFDLSGDLQDKVAKALSAKLDRKVNVQSSIDKSLLGGVVIRAGDTVIDGSVRGRLAKLAEAMNS
jgi:F-type H+-transporting ATPase subunit delta